MHGKDIYILYINEAWRNGDQKGDVFSKKGCDQMPFKVRSFTAMAALSFRVLWWAALCLIGTKRRGKKPQTTWPYHFARYQFLLDCTIKELLIDLLIAKQILQVL